MNRSTPNQNSLKTHCSRGHPFSESNLLVDKKGDRRCSACKKIASLKRRVWDEQDALPWSERSVHKKEAGHNFPRIKKCIHGHEIVEGNVGIWVNRVGGDRVIKCRACDGLRAKKQWEDGYRPPNNMPMAKAKEIVVGLQSGMTFQDMAKGPNRITHWKQLSAFRAANPKLGARMLKMATDNAAAKRVARCAEMRVSAPAIHRSAHEAMALISRSVPYQNPNRDEIISLMAFDFAEGRLAFNDIPASADKYRRKADRQSEDKLARGRWGNNSIDAPLTFDTTTTIAETISVGFWT